MDFYAVSFAKGANFSIASFSGARTSFLEAKISGGSFYGTTFANSVVFESATFTDETIFHNTTFTGITHFKNATFSGDVNFTECQFEKLTDFRGCLYPETGQIDFSGTTEFSRLVNEWTYDPQFNTENNTDRKRRGLKGKFKFDETFFSALIRNYEGMGWLKKADDAYYTYRVEKRRRLKNWWRRWGEFIFLEFPFGYGVKPLFLILFGKIWIR